MRKIFILVIFISTLVSARVPNVSAKSYIVMEMNGSIILEHNSKIRRPIASITKLLVAEQIEPEILGPSQVKIESIDLASKRSKLKINSSVTQNDLLQLALIPSNNQAIYALTRVHDSEKIISAVNNTAMARGLSSISIEEPSGLSKNNQASAEDLAKFVSYVQNTAIAKISIEPFTSYGHFHSTNPLLGKSGWNFSLSKTGFTDPAGGCMVTIVEFGGRQVIVVILASNSATSRWKDLIKIRSQVASLDSFWASNTPYQKTKEEVAE